VSIEVDDITNQGKNRRKSFTNVLQFEAELFKEANSLFSQTHSKRFTARMLWFISSFFSVEIFDYD